MAKQFALSAVLTVREQWEQAEERALLEVNTKCMEVQNALREIAKRMDREAAARLREIGEVQPAAHHQVSEQHLASLRSAQADMQKQLLVLEQQRKQQQDRYLAAHSGREVLTDLRKRALEKWEKDESLRDQKRVQDLLLSRRKLIRNSRVTKRS